MLTNFLRHGSNALLAALAAALVAAFAARWLPFTPPSLLAVAAGAGAFFASEYTTHRFLFHAPPQRNGFVLRLQHRLHYDHHVTPNELGLLFLPAWFVVPVAALTYAIFLAIVRDGATAASMLLGAVLALFYYEWVHYVAHIPFVPRTPAGRWIKKYHLRHHFLNERQWFGVTNPSMDLVGRTFARTADVERSSTTRVLFPK